MFVRTKTFTNKDGSTRTYLQIVDSHRENGRVRQRVVATLGRIEDLVERKLDRLIESLAKYSHHQWVKLQARGLLLESARHWGYELVFHRLWENLGLAETVKRLVERTALEFPVGEAIWAMVLNRLCDPSSKRQVSTWVDTVYRPSFGQLALHHYYRALDFLAEHQKEIEERLFARTMNLFNYKLDLVFWDTTSTYFTGRGPAGLAALGYSRDHRPDCYQVVIGLLMTREGIPVAHRVFPGNTADVVAFRTTLKELRQRFELGRIVLVADRGVVSKELLAELERQGLEYIVGLRLRSKEAAVVLATGGRYRKTADNLLVKEVWHDADRYIVCYNPERAAYEQRRRQEILEQLAGQLAEGGAGGLVPRGYRRFLKVEEARVSIDQEAVERAARYDGRYVLRTNNTDLDPEAVARAYRELWRIERAFRELKTGLELRPVFHWTPQRVRGHIMVCFLALVLESALQRSLRQVGSTASLAEVLHDLDQLHAAELHLDGRRYLCRTPLVGKAYEAFKAVGLRPPPEVSVLPS